MINLDKSLHFFSLPVNLLIFIVIVYRFSLPFMAGIALCRTTCRKIYDLLLDLPGVKPRPSAASFWVSVVGRPINRWASLSPLKMIENNKNDLLWLIIHREICVQYAFKVWGFEI